MKMLSERIPLSLAAGLASDTPPNPLLLRGNQGGVNSLHLKISCGLSAGSFKKNFILASVLC